MKLAIVRAFPISFVIVYSFHLTAADSALSLIKSDDTNSATQVLVHEDRESLRSYMAKAAELNAAKWVQFLIRQGISPDTYTKSPYGNCALEIARNLQHTNVLQVLVKAGADLGGANELMLAIMLDDKNKFDALLRDKPELIHQDDNLHRDAMHEAITYRRGDMTYALAKKGASHRFSPIELAIAGGNFNDVIAMLNQTRLNGRIDPLYGHSPLMIAVHFGRHEILSLLLKHGAELEAQSRGWKTALMCAVRAGDMQATQLLLESRADPNHAVEGQSPLTVAISRGFEDVALLLLKHGADPDVFEDNTRANLKRRASAKGLTRLVAALEGP